MNREPLMMAWTVLIGGLLAALGLWLFWEPQAMVIAFLPVAAGLYAVLEHYFFPC